MRASGSGGLRVSCLRAPRMRGSCAYLARDCLRFALIWTGDAHDSLRSRFAADEQMISGSALNCDLSARIVGPYSQSETEAPP